ncbi:MAG: GDSL-type esterase/lipase family protein [Planctomycetia bacterium]|nr:GDSL-type esterase/lipase family protein [Planctomycetia bacterium]
MKRILFIIILTLFWGIPGTGIFASDNKEPGISKHVATTPVHRMNENWWQNRYEQKVNEAKTKEIDILLLGDSITHGWDNHKELLKKFFGEKVLNFGMSGDRTEHTLWILDQGNLDALKPKMIMLMIGTNNIGHHSSTPEMTVDGITEIIKRLQKKFPDSPVLLLAVFPRDAKPDGVKRNQVLEINKNLPPLADGKKVEFLDLQEKFLDPNGEISPEIMRDFLHPTKKGYEIWGTEITPFIKKWVYPE